MRKQFMTGIFCLIASQLPAQTKAIDVEKHQPVVMLFEKDDNNILYLEDSTRLGKFGFYGYTDWSVIERKGKPAWIKDLTGLAKNAPLLLLDNHPVTLSGKIGDLPILMPTYIQTLKQKQGQYLMLSLHLVSFSGGSGWAHILLKVDAAGKVVKDKYMETAQMVEIVDVVH